MSRDRTKTEEFPKVPVERPPPRPSSSRPSAAPASFDDDVPTQPGRKEGIAPLAGPSAPDRALLTVLSGHHVGRAFTIDRDETVIGRGSDASVHFGDVGISRRHARIVRAVGGGHTLEDLGSTNGVFINGRPVQRADLADGDRVQVGPSLVLRFSIVAADEEAVALQLYEGSTKDALTRIYNRGYAVQRLIEEIAYAHRHGTPLGLVLLDIDHFKRINDSLGHPAGDGVLRVVSAQVQRMIRKEDVFARYGGEEFVVIVRGIELKNMRVLAERIRKGVERLSIPWESRMLNVTVSIGVAALSECEAGARLEALTSLADERLYEAKRGGRNRVC